jgi:predicted metal-binding protein
MTTTIFVCDTCRWTVDEKCAPCGRTGGEILAGHVERLAVGVAGVEVRRQSCLMGCERHCNTAIGAPGKLTYVLGAFEPGEEGWNMRVCIVTARPARCRSGNGPRL